MKRLFVMVAFLLIPALCWAANSSVTQSGGFLKNGSPVYVWSLSWTADDGNGTVPDTAMSTAILNQLKGHYEVYDAMTNPGSTAPTDNYDITIENSDGDVFGGALANRDTANTEWTPPYHGGAYVTVPVDGTLTHTLSNNSVNSATGVTRVYFRRIVK